MSGPSSRAEGPGKGDGFVTADLGSASASAGPLKDTVGLSADTGVGVSADGLEAKVQGSGFTLGRKVSASLFGIEFEVMVDRKDN
ncbi:hypothetical protein KUCAC02_012936 [Chaenocephalus aceratus]|uniref:Uncharacterized protein n=1 Tax=Chaenocephalus aceratus TaxID=36190 RepID=A0ACB9XE63_CHAAC|nr:hypothetical protein KUCAC02_012936 [Chaenocephalus aceratus]